MFCSKYCCIYCCQILLFFFVLGDTLAHSGNPIGVNGIRPCVTSVQQDIYWNIRLLLTDLSVLRAMTLTLVPIFAEGLKSAHVYLYFFNWRSLHTYSCWTPSSSVDAMKHIPCENFTSVNKVWLKPPCTLLSLDRESETKLACINIYSTAQRLYLTIKVNSSRDYMSFKT